MPPGVTTVSSRISDASSRTSGARRPLAVRRARLLAPVVGDEAPSDLLLSATALLAGDDDSAGRARLVV